MSYVMESEYLNLKNQYFKFEYEHLTKEYIKEQTESIGSSASNHPVSHENLTQNTFLFLQEKDLLLQDVSNLCFFIERMTGTKNDQSLWTANEKKLPFEKIKNRVSHILHKYIEQPALLDPLTEPIVVNIMRTVETYIKAMISEKKHCEAVPYRVIQVVEIVSVLCMVRGFKQVEKFFPHDVHDLEPTLYFLVTQAPHWAEQWEPKYIFLVWLSIIVLAPFDLQTFDSKILSETYLAVIKKDQPIEKEAGPALSIEQVILETTKVYLKSTTKLNEMAAVVLAKFFKRRDVQEMKLLPVYLSWCKETFELYQQDTLQSYYTKGILNSVFQILMNVSRSDLLPLIPAIYKIVFDDVWEKTQGAKDSSAVRHLKAKITQRIALTYLPQVANAWAYKKSASSLLANMNKTIDYSKIQTNVAIAKPESSTEPKSNGNQLSSSLSSSYNYGDCDIDCLEDIIDYLLMALTDKDTIVRWSAAKGIGRITARLDDFLADEVVSAVLAMSTTSLSESSFHGICLTLGELSRRGLLLPSKLPLAFPLITKALLYELNQGTHATGDQVRDAACFDVWAFARAYEPAIIRPHLFDVVENLLIVAVYDREVNCRRAASAAFQELVGRVGGYSKGIEILTEADFFTLGLRTNAFLNVAVYVAHAADCVEQFALHLAEAKLRHPDVEIRRLAAAGLALLAPLKPEFFAQNILPKLVELTTNDALHVRHGAIYGVSDVLLGLGGKGALHNWSDEKKDSIFLKTLSKNEKKLIKAGEYMSKFLPIYNKLKESNHLDLLKEPVLKELLEVVNKIEKARLYRGKGGETMRVAVCRLITCVSMVQLKIGAAVHTRFIATIEECIKSPIDLIQSAACTSLEALSRTYCSLFPKAYPPLLSTLCSLLSNSPLPTARRGAARALGLLAPSILIPETAKIEKTVIFLVQQDPDARRLATEAIGRIAIGIGIERLGAETWSKWFCRLFDCMEDYERDKRGDIGSIVREAAMYGMQNMIHSLWKAKLPEAEMRKFLSEENSLKTIGLLLQQLLEKIDKMRLIAGSILQDLVDNCLGVFPAGPVTTTVASLFKEERINQELVKGEAKIDKRYDISLATHNIFEGDSSGSVFQWNVPHVVFPYTISLLRLPQLRYFLYKGLITSVGGLSESVYTKSYEALRSFLDEEAAKSKNRPNNSQSADESDELFADLLQLTLRLTQEYHLNERVITPLLNTLGLIMSYTDVLSQEKFFELIQKLEEGIKKEILKTKSVMRRIAAIKPFISIFVLQRRRMPAVPVSEHFTLVLSLLCDRLFPKVRKETSDELFVLISSEGESLFGAERSEKLGDLVLETNWLEASEEETKQLEEAVIEALKN